MTLGKKTHLALRRNEICVLRVFPDVLRNERALRAHVLTVRPRFVENIFRELVAEPVMLVRVVDLGVYERDETGRPHVGDEPGALTVEQQLVTAEAGNIDDLDVVLGR